MFRDLKLRWNTRQLKSDNRKTRQVAMVRLASASDPRAVDVLVAGLKHYGNSSVSDEIVDSLAKLGGIATPQLIRALSMSDIRGWVAKALGKIGDQSAVEPLLDALKEDSFHSTIPWALGRLGDSRAARPLLERLNTCLNSEFHWLTCAVIEALGEVGDEQALPQLLKACMHKRLAREAVSSIGRVLQRSAGSASLHDLRSICRLENVVQIETETFEEEVWYSYEYGDYRTVQQTREIEVFIDCAHVRQLAQQELTRRGDAANEAGTD